MLRHIHIIFLFWLLGALSIEANPLRGQFLRFQSLSEEFGMNMGTVNDIYQDQRGFLWFATWSGLFRFDGYEVKSYQMDDLNPNGLQTNKITSVLEDSEGFLWIGTRRKGVYKFDPTQNTFYCLPYEPRQNGSLSNVNVWDVAEDTARRLWIATENGLNLFNPQDSSIRTYRIGETKEENFIYSLLVENDSMWVGTEGGLFTAKLSEPSLQFTRVNLLPAQSDIPAILHNYVYTLYKDPANPGQLWIGTKGGLKQLVIGQGTLTHYTHDPADPQSLSQNFVQSIVAAPHPEKSALWVATFKGLNRFDLETQTFESFYAEEDAYSLNNHTLQSLCVDRTGILWIGSDYGVNKLYLNANPFYTVQIQKAQSPGNLLVSSLETTPHSDFVWVGTRGGGLFRMRYGPEGMGEPAKIHFEGFDENSIVNFVSGLEVDQEGNLWMTSLGYGAIKIEADALRAPHITREDYQVFSYDQQSLGDNYVMSVYQAASGLLWFGHWNGGVDVYDPRTGRMQNFLRSSDGSVDFQAYPIVTMHEHPEGWMWVGTRGGGLLKVWYDVDSQELNVKNHFQQTSDSQSIGNNFINCFFSDKQGRFWVGTENGLNLWDELTQSFRRFSTRDGLSSNIIQGIRCDARGRLWLSTQNGLTVCNYDPIRQQLTCQPYYKSDGLHGNYFYGNATLILEDETLLMGGIEGLTYFHPQAIKKELTPPQVVLTELRIFNHEVQVGEKINDQVVLSRTLAATDSIALSYKDRVISLAFSGIHFVQPAKNTYAYKLEGFDEDWVYTDAQHRIANYTNLPYRDYVFKVKAANADGQWSEQAVNLHIRVNPPWWLTKWAKVGYLLLGIGLLAIIRYILLIRLNYRNRLALARVEQDKLQEIDRMKSQFFTHVSHELRTPLTLILTPLEDLVKTRTGDRALHQTFVRMHRNGHRLLNMINQLLDLRKSEAGLMQLSVAEGNFSRFVQEILLGFRPLAEKKNIRISFRASHEPIALWYDRDQMEKVMFNLLSNAIKFTPSNGAIELRMGTLPEENACWLEIKDTGVGIREEELPHIFEHFYQAHNQSPDSTTPGSGVGLALSKNIIEAHHGSIGVESVPGQGTVFRMLLPLGDQHFTEEEKLNDFKGSEYLPHYQEPETEEVSTSQAASEAEKNARKHILIVEDNADIRWYLKDKLSAEYQVWEAENGAVGLPIAQEKDLSLIISDIAMPEMDGLEFCKHIKSDLQTSHIPVILLTARTSLIFKIDGFDRGADDYITKPFNIKLLKSRIQNLIQSREQLKHAYRKSYDLSPSQVAVESLDEVFLRKSIDLIEQHMDNSDFTVEIMGQELAMSRVQLYRKLKALVGLSPSQFIRSIRLKRAAQLLETQQYTVAEITYKVGFQDLKYFRERFKETYGLSPSKFAEHHDKPNEE